MEPTLRSARLLLRPLRADDVSPLAAILREPDVERFWPSYDEVRVREELLTPDEDLHVFALEKEGALVGLIQYSEGDSPEFPHAQLDLFLSAAARNQGLGPEAIDTLCRYLFDVRGHHRLTIDPAADNTRAHRAYEKVGFRAVGLLRHYERLPDGTFRDGLLMERLATDQKPAKRRAEPARPDVQLRRATSSDADALLAMMEDFNALEAIPIHPPTLREGVERLLSSDALGRAFLILKEDRTAGYALLTFGFDLEFNGPDAFLTELYVLPAERDSGLGRAALAQVEAQARALGIAAMHLMVRPQNTRALGLYQSMGYQAAPRMVLTHWLER